VFLGNINLSLSHTHTRTLSLPLSLPLSLSVHVYTDGNTTPEEVRRFSVCASRLPAPRQGGERSCRSAFRQQRHGAPTPHTHTALRRAHTPSHTGRGAEEQRGRPQQGRHAVYFDLQLLNVRALARNGETEAGFSCLMKPDLRFT